jgi:drug/metabolite transporter (DMT)-like permease
MPPTLLLILIVTLCTIGSQLILKYAVEGIAPLLRQGGAFEFLSSAVTSPWVILAVAIQASGYIVWMFVLTQERLSVAFAISGSFFYLIMAAASWMLFDERLTLSQWLGLVMISSGVLLIHFTGRG